jgi:hypothetical protein
VSLFKKGNRKDPRNDRGISVGSSIGRGYTKILKAKLEKETYTIFSEDQSGFRAGRSCTDNLFKLQQILEKRRGVNEEIHLALVDLEKRYDSVPRCKLWEALRSFSVDVELIEAIKELYNDDNVVVKHRGLLSKPVPVSKGLRQGCSLFPLLFNVYLQRVLKSWKATCRGMGMLINDTYLVSLNSAVSQIALAQDTFDLEYMMRKLRQSYHQLGLYVNFNKTEYMAVNSEFPRDLLIDDLITLTPATHCKHLGVSISNDGG